MAVFGFFRMLFGDILLILPSLDGGVLSIPGVFALQFSSEGFASLAKKSSLFPSDEKWKI